MAKRKTQGVVTIVLNGHTLTGEKRKGLWYCKCETMPDLARHDGSETLAAVSEFMQRALAATLKVTCLTYESK